MLLCGFALRELDGGTGRTISSLQDIFSGLQLRTTRCRGVSGLIRRLRPGLAGGGSLRAGPVRLHLWTDQHVFTMGLLLWQQAALSFARRQRRAGTSELLCLRFTRGPVIGGLHFPARRAFG